MQRKLLKEGTFYLGVVAGERNSGVCLAGRDEFGAKSKTQSARETWARLVKKSRSRDFLLLELYDRQ